MKIILLISLFLVSFKPGFAQLDIHVQTIISLAIDKSGNIFLGADAGGYWPASIYKIDTSGSLTVFASGRLSYADRDLNLSHADFSHPNSMVFDSKGNLYIGDRGKHIIKKISSGGLISIYAGNGKGNQKDGKGASAEFYRLKGMTIDSDDNIFIVDQDGKAIRKISSDGIVSTYMQNNSSIITLMDIAIDKKGNLFGTDIGGGTIKKIDSKGNITVFAGSQLNGHADGQGKAARFKFPNQICIDSKDNLYVDDDHYIRKISPAGLVSTIAGRPYDEMEIDEYLKVNPIDKEGDATKFILPFIEDITCDKSDNLYFTAKRESFVRMLRNGYVYTIGRWSESFTVRNNFKQNEIKTEQINKTIVKNNNTVISSDDAINEPLIVTSSTLVYTNTSSINKSNPTKGTLPSFPGKNKKVLSEIPVNPLNKKELKEFVSGIKIKLQNSITPRDKENVEKLSAKIKDSTDLLNGTAIAEWYNGAFEVAALIEINSILSNAADLLSINNLGAMLILGGAPNKAIPILKSLLQGNENNPMLLNNIGQAYAGLGELDTALYFLRRCIQFSPLHPDANGTIAAIEATRNEKDIARKHADNSLKGAYNEQAVRIVRFLDPTVSPYKLRRPFVNIPEYFNEHKFKLPRQCENTMEYEDIKAEYAVYRNELNAAILKFQNKLNDESSNGSNAGKIMTNRFLNSGGNIAPFYYYAGNQFSELAVSYNDDVTRAEKSIDINGKLTRIREEYRKNLLKVYKEFEEDDQCCGEGNTSCCIDMYKFCKAKELVKNNYLQERASAVRNWQNRIAQIDKKYLNELIYWGLLMSPDEHSRKEVYYTLVIHYLNEMKRLAHTWVFKPCDQKNADSIYKAEMKIPEPNCPIEIEIPLGIASLSITCDELAISGGEGALFNFVKNKKTGHSTLSIGIGANIKLGGGWGGLGATTGAGMSETIFITWDGNNKILDAGLQYNANANTSIKMSPELELPKGIKIKGNDINILSTGGSMGYKFGINSSFTFNEGPFKNYLNPMETQVNRNVKMYKAK